MGGQLAMWLQALMYLWRSRGVVEGDRSWPPFHQPMGRFFPHILLQLQVLLVFSSIAPLVQPIALLYCAL